LGKLSFWQITRFWRGVVKKADADFGKRFSVKSLLAHAKKAGGQTYFLYATEDVVSQATHLICHGEYNKPDNWFIAFKPSGKPEYFQRLFIPNSPPTGKK